MGIYTAQQPGASLGYCKGSSQMLALGVLDLASGGQALRRVGNVTVFFDAAHVVAIGIVSFKQHEVAMNRSHAARGTAPMNAAARTRYQKAAVQTTAPASARTPKLEAVATAGAAVARGTSAHPGSSSAARATGDSGAMGSGTDGAAAAPGGGGVGGGVGAVGATPNA